VSALFFAGYGPSPRAALVADFDAQAVAGVNLGVHGELTARLAGIAVKDRVRGHFRNAQNGVIGGRVPVKDA
jgi:hypothetical protein